jgi:glycosyltransferase involved in cell wall biosynthesis
MVEVLTFNHHYYPGYKSGGALRTIVNMVEQIGNNIQFNIVTSDRDLGDVKAYSGIKINRWNKLGNANVYYKNEVSSFFELIKIINNSDYDLVYLNSFFDYNYSIKILLCLRLIKSKKQIIIAPRGEFSKGAMNIKKHRKNLFLIFARASRIYNDVLWQASSQYEKDDIESICMPGRVAIVPDMPALPVSYFDNTRKKVDGQLKLCFISRISRIKNLDFALKVLSELDIHAEFDIYGPIEDESYWSECKLLIDNISNDVIIRYCGLINHNDVIDVFGEYDLFFFPTLGENYGHVILESMISGTPVLISDMTPWTNLESHGIGCVSSLDNRGKFANYIKHIYSMNATEYSDLRLRANQYASSVLSDSSVKEKNIQLFYNEKSKVSL